MRRFFTHSKNIERAGFIWNMLGSTVMAFQSVLLLMVLTRTLGADSLIYSGIFTIAFAGANLLLTVGKYGIHNYQVSDTAPLFSFGDYRASRLITTAAMLVCSVGYTAVSALMNDYSFEKSMILLWMCAFKAIDAIEDVYGSLYQQQGRLDVTGKEMTVRMVLSIIFFIVAIIISHNLLLSLILTTVFSLLLFLLLNRLCAEGFRPFLKQKANMKQVWSLLWRCLPLFLIGFMSFYLTNAPKYAIDGLLSEEEQACYGFIAMPIFVIGLMSNFIFNPLIRPMSEKWQERNVRWFVRRLWQLTAVVVAITAICVLGAWLIGIPVLSLLYNTDLTEYKAELLVLLVSGGFLALSNQLMTVITIIRRQKLLLIGYGFCTVLALCLSHVAVKQFSMMGAAMLELVLMVLLCVIFTVVLLIGIATAGKKPIEE